jgi:predicted DNA binding CopG/RHH family protein
MAIPPHNQDSTDPLKVKLLRSDTLSKKTFQIRLQGLMLAGLEDYAKERGLSYQQVMQEALEKLLLKSGDLPDWWLTRKGNG